MTRIYMKFFSFIFLVGLFACLQDSISMYGQTPKEVKKFRKIFKAEVIDKLNRYAVSNGETGKEYILLTPEDIKETLDAEIILLFDRFLKYKPALPYEQLKSLMNQRKKYFLDGIYREENLIFEKPPLPERVILIEVLPGKKNLRCRLIRHEKNKSVTSLATYTFETVYILTDSDRINFNVTQKGCDMNKHLAYERAKLYIKVVFVKEVFPSWLDLVREELDNKFVEHIRQQVIGMTPPGIDYTPENEAQFFKEGEQWCVWVKGSMKKNDFDQWARAFNGVSK